MPLPGFEFWLAMAIVIGIPVATILLNRHKRGRGWIFLAGLVAFIVIGNIIESLLTK